jgi:glutamate-5-semialdehyde dehydrogenase
MSIKTSEVVEKARKASEVIHSFFPDKEQKNKLLIKMGERLIEESVPLIEANQKDLEQGALSGLSEALLDRLKLTPQRIEGIALGLKQISELPDPIGEALETIERPNGLKIIKKRVPLGVIGIIYEARPNVTVDAVGLCLKTGNAVVLRGGSAAFYSNQKIIQILHQVMQENNFPEDYIQLIEDTDRSSVTELLTCKQYIDVIIPRGGRSLIQHVVQNAVVPVIETGEGICHLYIHEEARYEMAESIAINAKCQRPSVCNAIESLLIDHAFAEKHLKYLLEALQAQGVEIRGCQRTIGLVEGIQPAVEDDWNTEYLDLILSVKVVEDLHEAIQHIKQYGTKHSEAILTQNEGIAAQFMREVDAAAVYHNASTRFTDGFEFGFGAEIGISTQKLHARGPMGLRELTSTKYYVLGEGQIKG